jgi:argininosuccinate lyase
VKIIVVHGLPFRHAHAAAAVAVIEYFALSQEHSRTDVDSVKRSESPTVKDRQTHNVRSDDCFI